MDEDVLQEIEKKRYNKWGHRRPLRSEEVSRDWDPFESVRGSSLSSFAKVPVVVREITGSGGIEFVAISNVVLPGPQRFPTGVIVFPWFYPDLGSFSNTDEKAHATLRMRGRARWVYDGWMDLTEWSEDSVRKAVNTIDRTLSVLSLKGSSYATWETKYGVPYEKPETFAFRREDAEDIEILLGVCTSLPAPDAHAVFRSLSWLGTGMRGPHPTTRIICSVLAVESMAFYVERDAEDDSRWTACRGGKLTKGQRREARITCIREALKGMDPAAPDKCVQSAYFDCIVGLKKGLRMHLEHVFGPGDSHVGEFFDEKDGRPGVFSLRNDIAHGRLDILDDETRNSLRESADRAASIAKDYLVRVMHRSLGTPEIVTLAFPGGPPDFEVGSSNLGYIGPTFMGTLYS